MQVEMEMLTDPWHSLEHATQLQLADPDLEAAVKTAVRELHAVNNYCHGDIRRPNVMFK